MLDIDMAYLFVRLSTRQSSGDTVSHTCKMITNFRVESRTPGKKTDSAIYYCPLTAGNEFRILYFVTPYIQIINTSSYLTSSNVYSRFLQLYLVCAISTTNELCTFSSERSANIKSRTNPWQSWIQDTSLKGLSWKIQYGWSPYTRVLHNTCLHIFRFHYFPIFRRSLQMRPGPPLGLLMRDVYRSDVTTPTVTKSRRI